MSEQLQSKKLTVEPTANEATHMDETNREAFKPTANEATHMDEANREAFQILKRNGSRAAVKHMVEAAGGDYSVMRSMFG